MPLAIFAPYPPMSTLRPEMLHIPILSSAILKLRRLQSVRPQLTDNDLYAKSELLHANPFRYKHTPHLKKIGALPYFPNLHLQAVSIHRHKFSPN